MFIPIFHINNARKRPLFSASDFSPKYLVFTALNKGITIVYITFFLLLHENIGCGYSLKVPQ